MYSLYLKILLILLLIVSYNLVILCQAKKLEDKKVKSITYENVKLDSTDVNSYIKNINIKSDEHPDRIAYLYGKIYSDFRLSTEILSIDVVENVYVKKIYFQFMSSSRAKLSPLSFSAIPVWFR